MVCCGLTLLNLNHDDVTVWKGFPNYWPFVKGIHRDDSLYNDQRGGAFHYDDVIMDAMASQITSLTIVYSTVYSDTDQWKHQSSAPLAFVLGIHRGPVNSPQKWPVTRKMSPFDDVIISWFLFNPQQDVEKIILSVIWDVITLMWCHFISLWPSHVYMHR